MAIYEVVLRALYHEQNIINVFTYVDGGGVGAVPSAFDLLTAMGFVPTDPAPTFPADTVFDSIRNLVSTNVLFTEVEARNLYSTTDFYLLGYSPVVAGLVVGAGLSPAMAYGLKSNRVRTDIRRGFKRFVGVVEEGTSEGGIVCCGFPALVTDVAEKMSALLSGTSFAVYHPAVASFEKYTTPSGRFAYKPYATEAEQLDHTAHPVTWSGYTEVRTQTSRQYGRGA